MTTERLGPNDVAAYDAELARPTVDGAPRSLGGRRIEIADYDPAWPELYEREEARIRSLLGDRVVRNRAHGLDLGARAPGQADHRHLARGA